MHNLSKNWQRLDEPEFMYMKAISRAAFYAQ